MAAKVHEYWQKEASWLRILSRSMLPQHLPCKPLSFLSFRNPPFSSFTSEHLGFDCPRGTAFLPRPVLMHLHGHPHCGEQPAIVRVATHPTPLQLEDVFEQPLHRFDRIASLFVEFLVLPLVQHLDHLLAR